MNWKLQIATMAALIAATIASPALDSTAKEGRSLAPPVVVYASQSGWPTLDQGEGGGNPFASALVELLALPRLSFRHLSDEIVVLTKEKSGGHQVPEVVQTAGQHDWKLKPIHNDSGRRVALVFVFADYREVGVSSLPGAVHDLERAAKALVRAGFEVESALDPSRERVRNLLDDITGRSQEAEAAIIYVTGHGAEHQGEAYLLPNDFPFDSGTSHLSERAIRVNALGDRLRARRGNLVFFGGCRTYMRDSSANTPHRTAGAAG